MDTNVRPRRTLVRVFFNKNIYHSNNGPGVTIRRCQSQGITSARFRHHFREKHNAANLRYSLKTHPTSPP